MSLDCLGQTSEFEIGAPTSEEEVEKKKSQSKRAPKSLLAAVLENCLLSILRCRFSVISVAHFLFVCRWCRDDSGSFPKWSCIYRRGDWWAVEGASHICYQEPGTVRWGAPAWWPWVCPQSMSDRELLEPAFGNICVQMRNLLVLFHVDSKFLPHFLLFRSIRQRSRCHCNSCHRSSDGVLVSLHLWGRESTTAFSLNE